MKKNNWMKFMALLMIFTFVNPLTIAYGEKQSNTKSVTYYKSVFLNKEPIFEKGATHHVDSLVIDFSYYDPKNPLVLMNIYRTDKEKVSVYSEPTVYLFDYSFEFVKTNFTSNDVGYPAELKVIDGFEEKLVQGGTSSILGTKFTLKNVFSRVIDTQYGQYERNRDFNSNSSVTYFKNGSDPVSFTSSAFLDNYVPPATFEEKSFMKQSEALEQNPLLKQVVSEIRTYNEVEDRELYHIYEFQDEIIECYRTQPAIINSKYPELIPMTLDDGLWGLVASDVYMWYPGKFNFSSRAQIDAFLEALKQDDDGGSKNVHTIFENSDIGTSSFRLMLNFNPPSNSGFPADFVIENKKYEGVLSVTLVSESYLKDNIKHNSEIIKSLQPSTNELQFYNFADREISCVYNSSLEKLIVNPKIKVDMPVSAAASEKNGYLSYKMERGHISQNPRIPLYLVKFSDNPYHEIYSTSEYYSKNPISSSACLSIKQLDRLLDTDLKAIGLKRYQKTVPTAQTKTDTSAKNKLPLEYSVVLDGKKVILKTKLIEKNNEVYLPLNEIAALSKCYSVKSADIVGTTVVKVRVKKQDRYERWFWTDNQALDFVESHLVIESNGSTPTDYMSKSMLLINNKLFIAPADFNKYIKPVVKVDKVNKLVVIKTK